LIWDHGAGFYNFYGQKQLCFTRGSWYYSVFL